MHQAFQTPSACSVVGRVDPTPSERQAVLARRLREARRRSGLSATAVAGRIHRSRAAVHEWESGRTNPTAIDVAALADAYGCSTDWLLGRDLATGFFALIDTRCERLLLSTTDLKQMRGRRSSLSCMVHEDVAAVTDLSELADRIHAVADRGRQLEERENNSQP